MAATFEFCDGAESGLIEIARLDAMVTVVDAVNLLADYGSHDFLRDRGETRDETDERTLVELLVDQIEFADIVVLNKVTTAGSERTAKAPFARSTLRLGSSRPTTAWSQSASWTLPETSL